VIDESDPVVRAMRAQFAQISTLHKSNVDKTIADYHQAEAADRAHQEQIARQEAEMPTPPPDQEPENPWLTRKRTTPTEPDGTETGYYSGSFMERR
jgi:hypothetical protein